MYFNPRSPHGERRADGRLSEHDGRISIHAPRTGSDISLMILFLDFTKISIHAPRTGSDVRAGFHVQQQYISIHAPRTGSDSFVREIRHGEVISIHAPRTGSDHRESPAHGAGLHYFNPRSPHGERLILKTQYLTQKSHFNPRSPHGERLIGQVRPHAGVEISIHAPRTGSDLPLSADECQLDLFQSTLPARGATTRIRARRKSPRISIHAPRTGSDRAK